MEPATPGLQGIGLSPTPRRLDPWDPKIFCGFRGINQLGQVGLRFVRWLYDGNSQRLTERVFMEKLGIELANPGLQA